MASPSGVGVASAACAGASVSARRPDDTASDPESQAPTARVSATSMNLPVRNRDRPAAIRLDRTINTGRCRCTLGPALASTSVSSLSSLIDFVKSDLAKLIRFAAVSVITVPLGMALFWIFLEVADMRPVLANVVAVSISTIPNYILNRRWVWNKRGANSVRREIAPFWAMSFLGFLLSTLLVAIADQFTDATIVFLAANFVAFGIVWVFKFFVLEKYLFGPAPMKATP